MIEKYRTGFLWELMKRRPISFVCSGGRVLGGLLEWATAG
jgi:hypothetical protein